MQFSIAVDVFFVFIDTLAAGGLKTTSEVRDDESDSSITSSSSVELSSAKLIVLSGSGVPN